MKQTKKALVTMAACTLIGAMAIGGTFAYLTDEEQQVNTFTVGNVKIDLQEPGWDPDHPPVVPNEEVDKNPTVVNTGTNSAYAFVKVQIPKKEVTVVDADGTRGEKKLQELFVWGTKNTNGTINWATKTEVGEANGIHEDWTLIEKDIDNGEYNTYIFAYKNPILPKKDSDTGYTKLTLFDKVKMINIVEVEELANTTVDMPIMAYAIQSDAIDPSVTNRKEDNAKLLAIYNVYAKQNKDLYDRDIRNASEGKFDLKGKDNEKTEGGGTGDEDTTPES